MARLKQNSANCLKAIQLDEQELYHIDREIQKIRTRYEPLCARLKERKAQRDELVQQRNQVAAQVNQLLANSKQRVRQSNNQTIRQLRQFANSELTATRGYSLGRESTYSQRRSSRK